MSIRKTPFTSYTLDQDDLIINIKTLHKDRNFFKLISNKTVIKIIDFVYEEKNLKGYSIKQIQRYLKLGSYRLVHEYIKKIEKIGLIETHKDVTQKGQPVLVMPTQEKYIK